MTSPGMPSASAATSPSSTTGRTSSSSSPAPTDGCASTSRYALCFQFCDVTRFIVSSSFFFSWVFPTERFWRAMSVSRWTEPRLSRGCVHCKEGRTVQFQKTQTVVWSYIVFEIQYNPKQYKMLDADLEKLCNRAKYLSKKQINLYQSYFQSKMIFPCSQCAGNELSITLMTD